MKKHGTVYSETEITFYPSYIGGIVLWMLTTMLLLGWVLVLLICPNPSVDEIVAFILISFALLVIMLFLSKNMFVEITINSKGILYTDHRSKISREFLWESVRVLYFRKENNWFGTETCDIYLKQPDVKKRVKIGKCDFVLPVLNLNKKELLKFIPKEIYGNDPYKEWMMKR
jgi:hypothetical protein